ncbi:MAG TPA: hypothetical protein VGM14_00095 [Streptosporangiaceae bacterium]
MPTTRQAPALASQRNPASPADQALAKIVDLLLPAGYGFTLPAWDGDAYLKINNALRAITDLTITSHGNVIWEYRSVQCPTCTPPGWSAWPSKSSTPTTPGASQDWARTAASPW